MHDSGVTMAEINTTHCILPFPTRPVRKVIPEMEIQAVNQCANHRSNMGVAGGGLRNIPPTKVRKPTDASPREAHPKQMRKPPPSCALSRRNHATINRKGLAYIAIPLRTRNTIGAVTTFPLTDYASRYRLR